MLPKAAVPTATELAVIITLGLLGTQDNTSIAETSKQLIK